MKLIRALNRWRKGFPLSSNDQHRVDNFIANLKIVSITLLFAIVVISLVDGCGGFDGRVSPEDLRQMP